jgi:hypothetical protein
MMNIKEFLRIGEVYGSFAFAHRLSGLLLLHGFQVGKGKYFELILMPVLNDIYFISAFCSG